jgi:hypothetical protein
LLAAAPLLLRLVAIADDVVLLAIQAGGFSLITLLLAASCANGDALVRVLWKRATGDSLQVPQPVFDRA